MSPSKKCLPVGGLVCLAATIFPCQKALFADRHPSITAADQWIRSKLADYKAPDRILLLPSLPLTSMMKVDKAALRELLESGSSGPDGSRPKK